MTINIKTTIIILQLVIVSQLFAQQSKMVADINKSALPFSSNPQNFTVYNGKLYFTASTLDYERELWVYDGKNPASLVANINKKGQYGANVDNLAVAHGVLYFTADDSTHGRELWSFDGDSAPKMVFDFTPGADDSYIRNITEYRDGIIFYADGALYYYQQGEPFKEINDWPISTSTFIEGKTSGEFLVQDTLIVSGFNFTDYGTEIGAIIDTSGKYIYWDLIEGKKGSNPRRLIKYKGKIYFSIKTEIIGREVCLLDSVFIRELYNIKPGSGSSNPYNLRVLDDTLWFEAEDSLGRNMVYCYGGANVFTTLDEEGDWDDSFSLENVMGSYNGKFYVKNKTITPDGFCMTSGDYLYYDNSNFSQGAYYDNNMILYNRAKGTNLEVKADGRYLSVDWDNGSAKFNDKLYFCASDGVTGYEVWSYDDINGALPACDIFVRTTGAGIKEITNFNNSVVFIANDGIHGNQLWQIQNDGIPEMITGLKSDEAFVDAKNIIVFNNKLYFTAYQNNERNIWVYDGKQKPYPLNFELKKTEFIWACGMHIEDEQLCFTGQSSSGNPMQWQYDGINQPTQKLNVTSDAFWDYFNKTDLSESDLLSRFKKDQAVFEKEALTIKDKKIVVAFSKKYGFEPWVYSNAEALPQLLGDLSPGTDNSDFTYLFKTTDELYFYTLQSDTINFWAYNGISKPVLIESFDRHYIKSDLVYYNNKIYFAYNLPDKGLQLYCWDGKSKSIQIMKIGDTWSIEIEDMYVALGKLFIYVSDYSDKRFLCLDKNSKTVLINDEESGIDEIIPGHYYANDNYLIFVGSQDGFTDVWLYDGVKAPVKISNIDYEQIETNPGNFLIHNNILYYTLNDGIHGSELWTYPLK